ncbi:MAG TPA: PepSY domain-containing protein [Candidatus Acidoferrum sp.]|nr:PepSY domain-containing protein [Candidatus Acidoferrum sp.]
MVLKKLNRWLYLVHRWFGVVMCVFIALWFATGIIMMYVEYPELTEVERLQQLEPIAFDRIEVDVGAAAASLHAGDAFSSIKLAQVLGRPAYQFAGKNPPLRTVFADTGEELHGLQPEQALLAARHSGFSSEGIAASYQGLLAVDQWTVSSELHASRPLHKVAMNDDAGTVVYVSNVSGQIVRDSNRRERMWNWFGSTIHWIYPYQLRQHQTVWANLLIYLSLAGVIVVLTGGIVGFIRLRVMKPYHGSSVTPYRGIRQWHHLLGLGCLLFVSTFMFSGLMSMSPWGLFDNATAAGEQVDRYTGGPLSALDQFPSPATIGNDGTVKEVEWQRIGTTPLLVLSRSATDKQVLANSGLLRSIALRRLIDGALASLQPDARLLTSTALDDYDNYYYSHHNRYRPLPALRVQFDDAERSWYTIDLNTGSVVMRQTATDRVARWLYNGMHSLDFALVFQHRPLWDVLVILLCIIGFGFALTSVVLGWRRLTY